jgi:hypothetical protein
MNSSVWDKNLEEFQELRQEWEYSLADQFFTVRIYNISHFLSVL